MLSVIASNDKISKNEVLDNSRPVWWQKKVDKRPALVVSDEPMGTGVPTWKEIDMFSSEVRKGRSYAFSASHSASLNTNHLVTSLLIIVFVNLFSFLI
ncbi:unnamed protein product [Medioppia subpectinata]|uniref:Uncharacterized protein n=1 Tax=Medioppia subpectinata TaxID=1979941 RepID=A0A7R9PWT7_9ACAR|nr:unnamed protein product [Medioppia subpectinata]CAG2104149.1 unnamed protein product [Medioppia subpectinata]